MQRTAEERDHELRAADALATYTDLVLLVVEDFSLFGPAQKPRIFILSGGNCAFAVFVL